MALPGRAFFTIFEAAARWGASPKDIIGWAADGRLKLLAGISYAKAGEDILSGIMELSPVDVIPALRPTSIQQGIFHARRLRPVEGQNAEWTFITHPEAGIEIHLSDVQMTAATVDAFERDCGLLRTSGSGQGSRYDWEAMYIAVAKRLYAEGIPESRRAFAREMQEWFIQSHPDAEAPDESTIRKKLMPVWTELELGEAS
ncbi:MAG: hypothetical protein GY772_25480 [bacterium]|nr:hypothetical protein [bacterium]